MEAHAISTVIQGLPRETAGMGFTSTTDQPFQPIWPTLHPNSSSDGGNNTYGGYGIISNEHCFIMTQGFQGGEMDLVAKVC